MAKFIETTEYTIVGESGVAAASLGPGERVAFNEEAASHQEIARGIKAKDEAYAHLSIVDIDPEDEAKQQEEVAKQLEKSEKLEAKEQAKEDKAAAKEEAKEAKTQKDAPAVPQLADADPPPQDAEAQELAEDDAAKPKPRARKARG